jgi:uncharacterized protein
LSISGLFTQLKLSMLEFPPTNRDNLPTLRMDYSRHLLIDAYNVIHQWPETRRELRRGSQFAREMLAAAVRVIHDREHLRVTLVFDGQGTDVTLERPGAQLTFSYLYAPSSMSADDVIERMVGASPDPGSFIVVTQDLPQRRTIEALGGTVLTPRDLQDWVARAERAVAKDLDAHRKMVDKEWNKGT